MTGRGAPCGACKFLRRKCVKGCVFAPYFCSEMSAAHFAAVHRVFGASNVSKMLLQIPTPDQRCEAAMSISYEAQARLEDPVYGCVSHIFALEHQVANLQSQLRFLQSQLAGSLAGTPQAVLNGNQYNSVIPTGPCTPNYEYSGHGTKSTNPLIFGATSNTTPRDEFRLPTNVSMPCSQNEMDNYGAIIYNGVLSKEGGAAVFSKCIGDYDELAMPEPFHVSPIGKELIEEDNYGQLLELQGAACDGKEP